jgi:hypothetical protein
VRAGRVDWRLVGWMAPPSVVGAIAGSVVSGELPGDVLLVVIGVVLLGFGVELLRPRRRAHRRPARGSALRGVVIAGSAIGFLGGVVGLILGSLRMPALLRLVRAEAARLVDTNLVVGVSVGLAGVVAHVPAGVDWTAFAVGAGASVPGALLGARLTGRLDERELLRAVGVVLVGAGLAAIVDGVT